MMPASITAASTTVSPHATRFVCFAISLYLDRPVPLRIEAGGPASVGVVAEASEVSRVWPILVVSADKSTSQIGPAQVGTLEIAVKYLGIPQVCAAQISVAQLGKPQFGPSQVGASQLRASQICPDQVCCRKVPVSKVRASQIDAPQIGTCQGSIVEHCAT
jgi:hypothetical protein